MVEWESGGVAGWLSGCVMVVLPGRNGGVSRSYEIYMASKSNLLFKCMFRITPMEISTKGGFVFITVENKYKIKHFHFLINQFVLIAIIKISNHHIFSYKQCKFTYLI